jgi:hypothetical protein
MKCILHENQSLVQEIRDEATAKNVFKRNENGQLHKRQLPEEIRGSEQGILWRTAQLWSQIALKSHGQSASRAKDFRRRFVSIGLSRDGLLFNRIKHRLAKALLQGSQLAAEGSAKETIIAHLHKSMRENMLEETLEELLERKGTLFELPGIGSAILKGDLRAFHTAAIMKIQQTAIANGHAMDIGSQVLERGLPIANGFAMNDPLLHPNLGRDLVEEFQFLQTTPEGRPK